MAPPRSTHLRCAQLATLSDSFLPTQTTATLNGIITDPAGAVIPKVTVTALQADTAAVGANLGGPVRLPEPYRGTDQMEPYSHINFP